jgi:hypothetical protein
MVNHTETTDAATAMTNVGSGQRTTARVSHSKGRDIHEEESACGIRSQGIIYFQARKRPFPLRAASCRRRRG